MALQRRDFLRLAVAGATAGLAGCATETKQKTIGRVVVIGGGFGGASAAKHVRMLSAGAIDVTLVERNAAFVSAPLSNLVLAGERDIASISFGYEGLRRHGVRTIQAEATAIDPVARSVRLATGDSLGYDRLVVAPGIDFIWGSVPGLTAEIAGTRVPHAWQAGAQTLALRRQLEDMPDGGVYALCIPRGPSRCLPASYERACLVAHYFRTHKPRSKVLVLDANADIQAGKALFMAAWQQIYGAIVEYRPNHAISSVDAAARIVKFEGAAAVRADVLNIVPPQRAGEIARQAGLAADQRWCGIDWRTMESTAQPGIHVLGDATLAAPGMMKTGHLATQQARIAAAAIVALLHGKTVAAPADLSSTCYSFVDGNNAAHATTLYDYDGKLKTMIARPGVSDQAMFSMSEAKHALAWVQGLWADALL